MIRFASTKDISRIMQFIDCYWKKNHILARDENIFRYEYVLGDKVNMIISENEDGLIDGIEGFIPYGKVDRDIMLALWKVNKSGNPMLGMEILRFLEENTDAKRISCVGINDKTIPIYKFMGYTTGLMNQWYRLGDFSPYIIAQINDSHIPPVESEKNVKLRYIDTLEELENVFDFQQYYASNVKPLKEACYIKRRYFEHPVYQYDVYIIEEDGIADSFVVVRVQEYCGSKAMRVVDFVGNHNRIYSVTKELDVLLKKYNAEYMDLYEAGLSPTEMQQAGWTKVRDSGNIIPNYFSPFLRENIEINYMSKDEDIVLFKADGDQDRPN